MHREELNRAWAGAGGRNHVARFERADQRVGRDKATALVVQGRPQQGLQIGLHPRSGRSRGCRQEARHPVALVKHGLQRVVRWQAL